MGWGRMLLLGNIGQQLDISDVQGELGRITDYLQATSKFDARTADTLKQLARENAELRLYLAATLRLLAAKGLVTEAELTAIVDTIDRSDGQPDGGFAGDLKSRG